MYAQLRSSANEIFTSVVVYSRTTKSNYQKRNKNEVITLLLVMLIIRVALMLRGNMMRKKTEHTRMYAQLCSLMNEIFTSVVVYSRTTTII